MNQYYAITTENSLAHHGILGQKWGVRRYQNPDGTLTRAGQKRYNNRQEAISKYEQSSSAYSKASKNASDALKSLEKDGINSKIFKEQMEYEMDPDSDESFEKQTGMSKEKFLKDVKKDFEFRKKYDEDASNRERAKADKLKNASISEKTFYEKDLAAQGRRKAGVILATAGGVALSAIAFKKHVISGNMFAKALLLTPGISGIAYSVAKDSKPNEHEFDREQGK